MLGKLPTPAIGDGPVVLFFRMRCRERALREMLTSLCKTRWIGRRATLYFDASEMHAAATEFVRAPVEATWDVRLSRERLPQTLERCAPFLSADAPASWVGLIRSPLLFHPEWLERLDDMLRSPSAWEMGFWSTRCCIAHRNSPTEGPPRILARLQSRVDDPTLILAKVPPGAWPAEFAPGVLLSGGLPWPFSLAASTGLLPARACVSSQSYADDLAFYEERKPNGIQPVLSPIRKLRRAGWGDMDLERIIPYNYYRCVQSIVDADVIPDPQPLDVVIPAAPRDLSVLPWTIEGARSNIDHPVGKIVIVGPPDSALRRMCQDNACEFVDEREISPLSRSSIRHCVAGVDRSAWIYQQLLKLNAQAVSNHEHFLVVDADTVLLRPQRFVGSARWLLRCSDEYHAPYFTAFERLMGFPATTPVSFVTHHMVVSARVLVQMKSHIERRAGRPWAEAILSVIDPREMSCFAEFETYGNWLLHTERPWVTIQYWKNVALQRTSHAMMRGTLARAALSYDSASFHHYLNPKPLLRRLAERFLRVPFPWQRDRSSIGEAAQ